MTTKNYRFDIVVLRFICIAIVVFFHGYGMTYVHFSPEVNELYRARYEAFNQCWLINLAMPMFVFISGFLFGGQLLRRQPVRLVGVIKSKFMRLLLPYFVFTLVFMLTTGSLAWQPFVLGGYWHLWFLPMLFWCFVVGYLLRPLLLNARRWVGLATLAVLSIASVLITPPGAYLLGLHDIIGWIFWFTLGMWFFRHESILQSRSVRKAVCLTGAIAYVALCALWPTDYAEIRSFSGQLVGICGIASLWCLVSLINWRDNAATRVIVSLSAASFGIYIFHNWLEMHMVSNTAKRLLHVEDFAADHVFLYPFLFCLTAFILSYIASAVLLKTRVGRKLIG